MFRVECEEFRKRYPTCARDRTQEEAVFLSAGAEAQSITKGISSVKLLTGGIATMNFYGWHYELPS